MSGGSSNGCAWCWTACARAAAARWRWLVVGLIRLAGRRIVMAGGGALLRGIDRLAAEGTLVARPGSGFYVAGKTRPLSLQAMGPRLDRIVDPLWITRQAQQAQLQRHRFGRVEPMHQQSSRFG